MFKDYYIILELNSNATILEIKKAYRRLALKYHPDRNFNNKVSEIKFLEIQEAYETLSNIDLKTGYDQRYRDYYQPNSQENSQKTPPPPKSEPITNLTYLQAINNIKSKVVSLNKDKINQERLYVVLNDLLTDDNIRFIQSYDELNVVKQIIHSFLICCEKLDYESLEKISLKLAKLAGADNLTIEKIYLFVKKRRFKGHYQKYNRKYFHILDTYVKPFRRFAFFIIIIILIIAGALSKNNNSNNDNRPTSGNFSPDVDSTINNSARNNSQTIDSSQRTSTLIDSVNADWSKSSYETGVSPSCYHFRPKYDVSLNNKLEVSVGSNTDVVMKLINKNTKRCIRYLYIRSGDVYDIEHIPQGIYYVKIAYGNDWREKDIGGNCIGKFMRNAIYEIGKNEFDFYKVYTGTEQVGDQTYRDYRIPSYSLSLRVINSNPDSSFKSNSISENEFNE